MNLKRLLMIVLPAGFAVGLWTGAGYLSGEADVMAEFETRCLNTLAKGLEPDLTGLDAPAGFKPEGTAKFAGELPGGTVLTHLATDDGTSVGCWVRDDAADGGRAQALTESFDLWAENAIQSGRYAHYDNCPSDGTYYFRVIRNVPDQPGEVTLRIAMSADLTIPSYALTATEDTGLGKMCEG